MPRLFTVFPVKIPRRGILLGAAICVARSTFPGLMTVARSLSLERWGVFHGVLQDRIGCRFSIRVVVLCVFFFLPFGRTSRVGLPEGNFSRVFEG